MLIPIKHYTSCEDLPLFNWIKLLTTGKLVFLHAESKKTWHKVPDLSEVWESIFNEYTELSKDESSNHVLSMIKNITVINNKLDIIQACVNLLAQSVDIDQLQPTIQVLKDFGFRYSYSKETLQQDLKRTVSSAKTLIIQRSQFEKDYEKFSEKQEKATEKDYYMLIAQLEKFRGVAIDIKKTNVLSYISYVEQYNNSLKNERTANK